MIKLHVDKTTSGLKLIEMFDLPRIDVIHVDGRMWDICRLITNA